MNVKGCSFDLLGHPVIAHCLYSGSCVPNRSINCLSLLSWACMCFILSVRMTRSLLVRIGVGCGCDTIW